MVRYGYLAALTCTMLLAAAACFALAPPMVTGAPLEWSKGAGSAAVAVLAVAIMSGQSTRRMP